MPARLMSAGLIPGRKSAPVRDHPLARGRLATHASILLGSAWNNGWLPTPSLDPHDLWAAAAKGFRGRVHEAEIGGRRPEDVADFRLRLAKLTQALEEQADLNPLGRAMAHGQLVRVIRNRLQFGALWTQRPELLATKLAPPIIVIGHMRSGTTRIHKLLAADPAHSHTRYCDAYHPVPASFGRSRFKGWLDLTMLGALNPWLQVIHPMASGAVEEELAWIAGALNHSIYESQWHVPGYSEFSEARDPAPIYREFARVLRSDAAHRGLQTLPRILKVPAFAEDLDTLLAQFPDARLVVAKRDSNAVLRSAVSLVANQMAVQSDNCDLARIETEWQRKLALREERMEAVLSGWNGPITYLHFDALNAQWQSEIARTYSELGLTLTDAALEAMQREMAMSAGGVHRAHSEQLARFEAQA
jgi:hypothetical protein